MDHEREQGHGSENGRQESPCQHGRERQYQLGKAVVGDSHDPATQHLPLIWEFADEWYDFRSSLRGSARILLRADEASYEGGGMGDDPEFRAHLLGGINWAARKD